MFRVFLRSLLLAACVLLAACTVDHQLGDLGSTPGAQNPGSSAAVPGDSGWQQVDAAMEVRTLRWSASSSLADVRVVRFDPAAYRVRIKYDPYSPGFLSDWNKALEPLAMINGGYFDENRRATGLVIFDGIKRGESYQGFGGMVLINAQGQFELRSLRHQAYDPNEQIQQAMQSAPMLIQPGGEVSQLEPDTDRSRRSVLAQDRQGRVLLIAIDQPLLTLPELAQALKQSDLDLDAALNLDGGRSTGLYLNADSEQIAMDSFEKVPMVLTVEKIDR